jgi:hypothetical protein
LRLFEGSKLVYVPVGESAAEALVARDRTEHKLAAKASAKAAGMLLPPEEPGRMSLAVKAREFIRDAEQRGATVAADVNRLVTAEFLRIVKRTYADEIDREDLFDFHAALRKRGCAERTIANKHARVTSFLRFAGVDGKILPPPPRYDETLPTIYANEEIADIRAAADP